MKPSAKKTRKRPASPDQIAAVVRANLAPAISALGVIASRSEFLDRIERMAATLALWGPKINLTANPTDPDEILFHVFDSIIPVSIAVSSKIIRLGGRLDRERRFLDIGSGAGFPGLVIAAAINAQVTLVEARRKRTTFLTEAAIEMGLANVHVQCVRAESLDLRDRFDLVTARAVGNNPVIFEIAGRALHPGGVLMLYASADQKFDDNENGGAAARAGLVDPSVAGYDLRHGRQVMRRAVATWRRG